MDSEEKVVACGVIGIFALILFFIGGCTVCKMTGGVQAEYSSGVREGVLRKFSTKGWFLKSSEGELALMGNKTAGVYEVWDFSAEGEDVVRVLEGAVGKNVRLHYKQVWVNDFRHETDYRVTKVEVLAAEPQKGENDGR